MRGARGRRGQTAARWRRGLAVAALAAAATLAAGAPALAARPGAVSRPAPVRALPRLTRAELLQPGLGREHRSPHPGSNSTLNAIYCPAAGNCWAVGQYEKNGAQIDQIQHWNGKKWTQVATPNPGGTGSGDVADLYGVRCLPAANCWAVGYYVKNHADLDQLLHWNGRKWSTAAAPTPGGTLANDFNELFGVTCTSASNCWAAGQYGAFVDTSQLILNQALHWNGKRWSLVSTPQPGGKAESDVSSLQAIRCNSASNCWAVGDDGNLGMSTVHLSDEALRWNGRKWSSVAILTLTGASDLDSLIGLTCTSAANCWAVGERQTPSVITNRALHWNGTKWSAVTTPNPDGTGSKASNILFDTFCSKPSNCWAVGNFGSETSGPGSIKNEALHYNGTKWTTVATPDPVGTASGDTNELNGVRCTAAASCWAVGNIQDGAGLNRNEILHWNGRKWITS
jgi:hypothetical protein